MVLPCASSPTDKPERMASAVRGPTPLIFTSSRKVARSPADGYLLVFLSTAHAVNAAAPAIMAVEAARDALTGVDRSAVGSVSLASTTLPFADRLNSGIVKEALNLPDNVAASDAAGSQRAGLASLTQALQAAPQRAAPHLCLAADMRQIGRASCRERVSSPV